MKYKTVVGIDPDVDKSGVATLDTKTGQMIATDLPFPFLVDFLRDLGDDNEDESIVIVVEASWLISYNWHTKNGDNRRVSAAKGNSTGRNHETGRKIVEMCKHYDLDVIEQRPLKKCWKGKDGKITHEELSYFIPGLPKSTNQEVRDAALLAWNYAGLPMKVKPINQKDNECK